MRIGFDARAVLLRGGIGTYSRNILHQFAQAGVEAVVFCDDKAKNTIPLADSFTLVSANLEPSARSGRAAFRALVKDADIDLLHVPSPFAPTPCPVPLVSTIHDIAPFLYPSVLPLCQRLQYRRQFKRTVAEARHIITVSQITYSALGVYAGVDQTKVRVIHNGVAERFQPQTDPKVLQATRNRHSLPERFGFWVGDFRPEKNLPFLIQAWAALRERLADVPALVLAGQKRGQYRKIKDEVRKHRLEDMVVFPGFIPDVDLPAVPSQGADRDDALLFSESAGRFIVSIDPKHRAAFEALMAGVPFGQIGKVAEEGGRLTVRGGAGSPLIDLPVSELKEAWMAPLGELI